MRLSLTASFTKESAPLPANPEAWTPKQLYAWLKQYEHGRFAALVPKLQLYSGAEVVHFSQAQWTELQPPDVAASLRFTLLGMVQVAESEPAEEIAIVTDYAEAASPQADAADVPLTVRRRPSASHFEDPTPSKNDPPRKHIKPVKFPPLIELPSISLLVFILVVVVAFTLAATVLKQPLKDGGVTTEELIHYGSIPVVSVVFTYVHIWLALWMTFYPLEYFGCLKIPNTNMGLGWQGIVPFKGEKMASQATQLMTKQLLRVKDVFARIEPQRVVVEIEPALYGMIRGIIEDMAQKYNPELWAALPAKIKEEIIQKVKEETPVHIEALMEEFRENIEEVFDLESFVVEYMCRDRQLLVNMFVTCGYNELAFIRNSGATMGFLFGVLQMGLWFFYKERIVVFPVMGLVVGTITNWLALKMIFEPVKPTRFMCWTLHGLFLRRQDEVADVYGRLVATEVLTAKNIIEAILHGPFSDRLFELVYDNIQRAVNQGTAQTEKILNLSLGTQTYAQLKEDITDRIVAEFPNMLRRIEDYALVALDLETTLREKMRELQSEQFEQLLHPIFQEDEWKLVCMGGALGLAIGLLQAFFINA